MRKTRISDEIVSLNMYTGDIDSEHITALCIGNKKYGYIPAYAKECTCYYMKCGATMYHCYRTIMLRDAYTLSGIYDKCKEIIQGEHHRII